MKKMLLVLTITMLTILLGFAQTPVSAAGGGGGPTTTSIDSMLAAKAFALLGDYWTQAEVDGRVTFDRKYPDGHTKPILVSLTVAKQGDALVFPSMVYDGVTIVGPDDPPATSFPNDAYGEMTNLNVNLWAFNHNGWVNGYFYSSNLTPMAPIGVEMTPGWRMQVVAIPIGLDQTGMSIWLSNNPKQYYVFDPNTGGYNAWFDSMDGSQITWQLQWVDPVDGSVTVIANGTVTVGGQPTIPSGSAMTAHNKGGVRDAYLEQNGESFVNYGGAPFEARVKRMVNGQMAYVPAAVINTSGNGHQLCISANGFHGTLAVLDPHNGMKLIESRDTGDTGDGAAIILQEQYQYQEVTVVVTGDQEPWGLSVWCSGTPPPFVIPITNGGGGLGAPPQPQQ